MPDPSPINPQQADGDGQNLFVMRLANNQLPLRSFIHTLVRRATDVDDILQETNMVLWEKRSEYDPDRAFMPWACRFAHFQTLAHLKRHKRAEHFHLDDELCEKIAAEAARQTENIETRIAALRNCMERLPSQSRQLIRQRYSDGTPVQRIAHEEGMSADAVSMRLFRIRKSLAECVRHSINPTA